MAALDIIDERYDTKYKYYFCYIVLNRPGIFNMTSPTPLLSVVKVFTLPAYCFFSLSIGVSEVILKVPGGFIYKVGQCQYTLNAYFQVL